MSESIHETPSVISIFNSQTQKFLPWRIKWRGRVYTVTEIGYHHTRQHGHTLHHIFSVTAGNLYFCLDLDTQLLTWKIKGVEDKERAL